MNRRVRRLHASFGSMILVMASGYLLGPSDIYAQGWITSPSGLTPMAPWLSQIPHPDLRDQILTALQRRAQEARTLYYRVRGTRFWPMAGFDDEADLQLPEGERSHPANPPEDQRGMVAREYWFDLPRNRHAIRWEQHEYSSLKRSLYQIRLQQACDGVTLYSRIFENTDPSLRPAALRKHTDVVLHRGVLPPGSFASHEHLAPLIGHGVLSVGTSWVAPGRLNPRPESSRFVYDREDASRGQRCHVLRWTEPGHPTSAEFWFEADRPGLVRMLVVDPDHESHPTTRLELEYDEGRDRMLRGWTWTSASVWDGRVRLVETVRVEAATLNASIEDERFVIRVDPGDTVQERVGAMEAGEPRLARETYYQAARSGTSIPLDPQTLEPRGQAPKPRNEIRHNWVWGLNALVLCGLLWWTWRKRRGNRPPRTPAGETSSSP
jgi:hypothetical protein